MHNESVRNSCWLVGRRREVECQWTSKFILRIVLFYSSINKSVDFVKIVLRYDLTRKLNFKITILSSI